jgi:hypothetical protein
MMKESKKRRFNLKPLLLIIIPLFAIACIFIVVYRNKIREDSKSILEQQRFIFVQNPEWTKIRGDDFGTGIDLEAKNLYIPFNTAVRGSEKYGGYGNDSASRIYDDVVKNQLSSALLKGKFSRKEIRDSNYKITRSPESLINKKLLKEEYPPEFELLYKYQKESQFSKIRITYNKEFLPTKIEWYYKDKEGLKWYTWRTYSYPFKNKTEFDKKLDEQIQLIKDIEEEHEAEGRDG